MVGVMIAMGIALAWLFVSVWSLANEVSSLQGEMRMLRATTDRLKELYDDGK